VFPPAPLEAARSTSYHVRVCPVEAFNQVSGTPLWEAKSLISGFAPAASASNEEMA